MSYPFHKEFAVVSGSIVGHEFFLQNLRTSRRGFEARTCVHHHLAAAAAAAVTDVLQL